MLRVVIASLLATSALAWTPIARPTIRRAAALSPASPVALRRADLLMADDAEPEEASESGLTNLNTKKIGIAAAVVVGGLYATGVPQAIFGSAIFQKAGKKALGGGLSGAIAGVVQVMTLMWLRTTMNYQYRYGTSTKVGPPFTHA